jgi:hypothetical protein
MPNFGTSFGAFVTRSCKNALVLSFICISAFNNLKSADMIATHVGEFLLKSEKNNGHFLRKPAHVSARISNGHG